jgi:hypothetical protein
MTISPETIDHAALQGLVAGGAVHGIDVIGQRANWAIVVKDGVTERTLAEKRGAVRTFRQLDMVVRYLKDIGISVFHVNAADFDSDAAPRIDSESEEKAHTDWMREKVAESLADPRPNIPNEQAMTELQAVIDAARKKRALKAAP